MILLIVMRTRVNTLLVELILRQHYILRHGKIFGFITGLSNVDLCRFMAPLDKFWRRLFSVFLIEESCSLRIEKVGLSFTILTNACSRYVINL